MKSGIDGLVALVTGASGGIGREIAAAYAQEGARLVLHANSRLEELEARVADEPWGADALCVQAELSDADALERAFAAARERFGRVDICAANAGVWPPGEELLHELSVERLQRTLAVDLFGAALSARAFFASLALTGPREDGRGAALVFTGSTAGVYGERGHADYAMSKAGLVGLTRTLKNEIVALDPYGRVNLVHPGWTVTAMARPALDDDRAVASALRTMPLQQLAHARDIARAVLYFSSPSMARHVTGESLVVAGGMEGRVLWDTHEIDVPRVRARLDVDAAGG